MSFIKQVQETFLKLRIDLKYTASTADMEDDQGTQLPGFTEWQVAHAQLCLMIQDLPDLGGNSESCPDGDHHVEVGKKLEKSCRISVDQCSLDKSRDVCKAESVEASDSCSRTKHDDELTMKASVNADDNAVSIVLSLITSSQYEVRELTLGALQNGSTRTNNVDSSPEDPWQSNLWSKVILSDDIFHVLVTMVTQEGKEDHPACMEKVTICFFNLLMFFK